MTTAGEARAATLRALADRTHPLLVIGGGVVGTGALLDAASRGIGAALIEQDDLAAGTSSRSSRLIHGGLRYLERLEIRLVREALAERSRLLRLAPHLVRLEPFLFPLYGPPLATRAFYGAGILLYDVLGSARDGGRARHLGRGAALRAVPALRPDGLRGAIVYHDGVEDDARLVIAVARTAEARGALVATRVRATGLLTGRDGRVAGVRAVDRETGAELEIRAQAVLDATGVWMGRTDAPLGGSSVPVLPSRGTHILVPRTRIVAPGGVTLRVPGKVLFLVPWGDAWIVGTTDEPDAGPPERPAPTGHEVRAILDAVNTTLDVGLRREEILGTYTGLRPLVGAPGSGATVRVSREHRVGREANGLVRISGGKYTTYRVMAADAVDAALAGGGTGASRTADLPLAGAAPGVDLAALTAQLAATPGLDGPIAAHLVARYGTEAAAVVALGREHDLVRPLGATGHLEAEVLWGVRAEHARSLDDLLARRMRLAMRLPDRGAAIAERVDAIASAELGWAAAGRADRNAAYLAGARREHDVPADAA
ncbi:MAG: glycerol-3-phosphate dehydrogenase/oxidase [Chloroflexota bacterium]